MAARIPQEKIADAKALRAAGHSISDVVALAKISRGRAHEYTKGIQLPFGPLKRGPKKKIAFNVCKSLRDQGLGVRAIARRLGCAPSAVCRTLKTGKATA